MKSTLVFCIAVASVFQLKAQYNQQNLKMDQATAAAAYRYGNLQLYPVRANHTFENHHKTVSKYLSLEDALKKEQVVISERGRSGEVNTLYIENVSKDTVMVLAGEVIKGGKQDRVIAQDFILYPQSGKKDVSVFCVEHGRWQPKEDGLSFKEYYSISSNEVRKAATVSKSQQQVWDKVLETTQKNKASTSTGTLAALQRSGTFNEELKKYIDHFAKHISSESDVIGLVAVSGDQVLSCDLFATHDLFASHYTGLVNSYATEAITSGKAVSMSYDQVKEYLNSIISDESKQEREVEKRGTMLKDGNRKLHISTF